MPMSGHWIGILDGKTASKQINEWNIEDVVMILIKPLQMDLVSALNNPQGVEMLLN